MDSPLDSCSRSRLISRVSAFTLMEMMIVITMIAILFSISSIPYGYYMDRARVDQAVDSIAQEWSLAHTEVKNGKIFTGTTNANIIFQFQSGSSDISIFSTDPSLQTTTSLPLTESGTATFLRRIPLERWIEVLAISGVTLDSSARLGYTITAPTGHGYWWTPMGWASLSGVILTVGYPWASLESRRAKEVLLMPRDW